MITSLFRRALAVPVIGAAFVMANAHAVVLTVDGDLSDMIAAQGQPTSGSTSSGVSSNDGFDIDTAYFHYDASSDTFYFGMSVHGTIGDSGFLDLNPAFDSLETYRFLFDIGNDGFDMTYSLTGDGVTNSGANTETVSQDTTPGGVNHAVSESAFVSDNGIEFSISGLGFAGDFTVQLEASSASNFDPVQISGFVVPIPAAAWLFGSGLLALIGLGRRKS